MESPVHTGELQSHAVLLMSLQAVAISSFPAVSGECQPIMHLDTDPVARRRRILWPRKYSPFRANSRLSEK